MEEHRGAETHGERTGPRRGGVAREIARRAPVAGKGDGDEQSDEPDAPWIAGDEEHWQDEQGHARRVDRVDLAVEAALQEVWRQSVVEVVEVVAAIVVVLNPQVAILQQTLRDDEVVRLVA